MKRYAMIFAAFGLYIFAVIAHNHRHPASAIEATPQDAQHEREATALSKAQHAIKDRVPMH